MRVTDEQLRAAIVTSTTVDMGQDIRQDLALDLEEARYELEAILALLKSGYDMLRKDANVDPDDPEYDADAQPAKWMREVRTILNMARAALGTAKPTTEKQRGRGMKLYKLIVSIPMVVLAEDENDARGLAMDHCREERPTMDDLSTPEVVARLADLPRGWEARCLPYADWKKVNVEPQSAEMNIKYFLGKNARAPLSDAEQEARRPLPPDVLANALQDKVHQDLPGARPARSVKVSKRSHEEVLLNVRPKGLVED